MNTIEVKNFAGKKTNHYLLPANGDITLCGIDVSEKNNLKENQVKQVNCRSCLGFIKQCQQIKLEE